MKNAGTPALACISVSWDFPSRLKRSCWQRPSFRAPLPPTLPAGREKVGARNSLSESLQCPAMHSRVIRPFVTCFTPSGTEPAKNSLGGPLGGEKQKGRRKKTCDKHDIHPHWRSICLCFYRHHLSSSITVA